MAQSYKDTNFLLIGKGRSTEQGYLTGLFYLINAHGMIGLLLFVWYILSSFFSKNSGGKVFIITIILLAIGSEYIVNFGILYYMSFIQKMNLERRIE